MTEYKKPEFFPLSEIKESINTAALEDGAKSEYIGSRVTTALRHNVARKNLLKEPLGFEMPEGVDPLAKDAETGEVYIHVNYLKTAVKSESPIEGLSKNPLAIGFLMLKKYVRGLEI
jgi:hypothetical protein